MSEFLKFAEKLISGMFPFALLMLCGLYLTFKGRFYQFTKLFDSVKLIIKALSAKKQKNAGVSSFQSACTALSATVGTGNIAGVAGAVSIGGAGAIFWMWISALLGMAIKCSEITLAILFRENKNGEFVGGPMYYIKNKLPKGLKFLSAGFALAGIPAAFCTGNITQSNSAILLISDKFCIRLTAGIIFTVLTASVVLGGAERIGKVTEKVIPLMSVLYTLLSLGVIILNIDFLPQAFKMIIGGAFNPKSVTGGCVGSVISCVITGASKGIFSNEAGLGTSAMAHSAAFDANAQTQGLFGIFEVFIDTILICTLTGLTILCSRVNIDYGLLSTAELVGDAFSVNYGSIASVILDVMMCFFAFSSAIGWALYGDICSSFLFGEKGRKIFMRIYPFGCLVGALTNAEFAWRISEFFNGIMLCINLPAVLMLSDNLLVMRGIKNDTRKTEKFKKIFKNG